MKNYYRVMLGAKSIHAEECFSGNYIGVGFFGKIDLTGKFYNNWRDFNKEFIPVYLSYNPQKKKIAAGLACATVWTVAKGIQSGDIVLCPNGKGSYMVGEIIGDYYYKPNTNLPHRRDVRWNQTLIERNEMSEQLKNSSGAIATYCNLTKHAEEIETLISGKYNATIFTNDDSIENLTIFALEKHLEEFLIKNWKQTELGKYYDIYEEDGVLAGQQYPTDTGQIDILALSKDKKTLLVVELKKGIASDVVVGQIQRYMGYVKDELAEKNQVVKGVIIAHEDDIKIKRSLSVTNNIEFYRYHVNFKLFKN